MAKLKKAPTKETLKATVEVKSSTKAGSVARDESAIEPAKGKLGVMIPGMGAVATTFVAGVEAVRKGIAHPIGSLTQMGTIRLGKRTDGRSPKIKEFVPLAGLDDLVFPGWVIFEDNMYAAARNAGVLERDLLDKVKGRLSAIKPMKAVSITTTSRRSTGRTGRKGRTSWNWRSSFGRTYATSRSRGARAGWSPSGALRPKPSSSRAPLTRASKPSKKG